MSLSSLSSRSHQTRSGPKSDRLILLPRLLVLPEQHISQLPLPASSISSIHPPAMRRLQFWLQIFLTDVIFFLSHIIYFIFLHYWVTIIFVWCLWCIWTGDCSESVEFTQRVVQKIRSVQNFPTRNRMWFNTGCEGQWKNKTFPNLPKSKQWKWRNVEKPSST